MSRIAERFDRRRRENRKALVAFLMAGDPDPAGSLDDARTALEQGADILELGVPFSDPTADGPTIQAAGRRALAAGMNVAGALDLGRALRAGSSAPILLFGYTNPFLQYGFSRLCGDAAAAGLDGLLVVDLPFEESGGLREMAGGSGLDLIPLVAPTTPPDRMKRILARASGFVYYVMVKGVTGARASAPADLAERIAPLRAATPLPIVAGFGVSDPRQARLLSDPVDGLAVGSALIAAAREDRLASFVSALRRGLDAR